MTEQAKVPAIRFAGFTDPWEQRKASEVFQIVDDRGHPTLPVLSATQNQGMIYRDDSGRYIGHDESNEIGYKRVLPGDFVVHLRSFQGGFAHSQYEGITSPAYTVFRAKEPTSHSDRFWKHWFMSEHFIAGLSTVTYGIRDGRSISVDEFMNTFLAFPAVEEQAAISRLFDYLDDLITLHQRKYDKLVIFKKSMLEKMFPKDGESVPEIRFAGFTDPWEQRKFSDMYEVNNERNTDCELGYDRTLSIATMTFNGGNGAADDSLNSYKVIRVGDIAFEGHANKVHAYGRFVLNDAGDGLMSPRFSCLRPIVEQRYSFWKYYIPHEETMRPILVKATKSGTMMNELVPDDLMRESILAPCLAEQEAIGDCLSQLDSLITLHQRKLELLQNIKKSLLDKMFV